ncbi:MAG: ATP phosphoribosyltransferase regulatory subunit, partial [Opitutales bacterium]|nr:ATP phosphoribosyltransferase regulatory subunit [Opitutales bacterium]
LGVIDKWERMPEDAILEHLTQIVGEGEAKPLLESIDGFLQLKSMDEVSTAFSTVSPVSDLIEGIEVRIQDWCDLLAGLEAMGVAQFVEMDMSIVRGLAYYTGFVFEAFDRAKENRAIAGGGRYDGLVKKMGGPDMPAVGFGMGDVVLADVLNERSLQPKFVNTIDIFTVIGGDAERPIALEDVNLLRQSGFSVDYSFKSQALGKQLKTASSSGARLALIYGFEEAKRDEVTIRDLVNREEESISRNRLLPLLRERLS